MRQKPGCRRLVCVCVLRLYARRRTGTKEQRVGRGGVGGGGDGGVVVGVGDLALAGQRVEVGVLMVAVVHGRDGRDGGWEEETWLWIFRA